MAPDEPYKAPFPLIHEVDDVKLRPIKAKLLAHPPEPVSMEEANVLLQWVTYLSINGLTQLYDARLDWQETRAGQWNAHADISTRVTDRERDLYHGEAPRHWGRFVRGKCDNTMNLVDGLLQELPDSMVCCFGTQNFARQNHVAIILSLPIIEDGVVTDRHFLVDPTLGQFFYRGSDRQHEVGERMMAEDADFSNTLLSQGYAEIDESRAKTYVTSFAPQILGERAMEAMAESNNSHLKFLLHDNVGFVRIKLHNPDASQNVIKR